MATQKQSYTGPNGQYSSYVPEIAGPKTPEKYDRVGPNYNVFGEQPGYVYYPLQDKYIPDPKYQKKFAEDNGFTEKKKGLQDALLPIAATGGTIAATQALFNGGLTSGAEKIGGLFGLGKDTATTTATNTGTQAASQTAANTAAQTGSTASTGVAPAAPNVVGASEVLSNPNVAQVLPPGQAPPPGMEVVGQTSDGGTMVAPTGAQIPASELGSLASQAGVVLQAYRIGNEGWKAYKAGAGQGAVGGGEAGFKSGGKLGMLQNLDPFALQARVFGGMLGGIFGSPSTQKVMQGRWRDLAEQGIITPEQLAAKEADLSRSAKDRSTDPITGKRWDLQTAMDRVKAGGAAADEFSQTLGLANLLGKDAANYTTDQKRAILAQNAQANNYRSDHGDVYFQDEAKAQQIRDSVLGGLANLNQSNSNAPTTGSTPLDKSGGLTGLLKSGDKMSNGKIYISPGVYR